MIVRVVIDTIFSFGLFINAMLFAPQAIRIIRTKSTTDLSLLTFGGFCAIQLSTIAYGWLQQDYFLMIGYVLSFITCGTVTSLIVVYRKK